MTHMSKIKQVKEHYWAIYYGCERTIRFETIIHNIRIKLIEEISWCCLLPRNTWRKLFLINHCNCMWLMLVRVFPCLNVIYISRTTWPLSLYPIFTMSQQALITEKNMKFYSLSFTLLTKRDVSCRFADDTVSSFCH